MANKQYVSDGIEKHGLTKESLFNDDYYPVITGGVGTGKSTFVCKSLSKLLNCNSGEILLTAPLSAIEKQLIDKGKAIKHDLELVFFEMDNVSICTFNKLKSVIKNREQLPEQVKYIVFDEAHNLITAETYAQYGSFFLKWLEDNNIQALFLTATPQSLLTYKYSKKPFKEILGVKSNVSVGQIYFTTETDLLNHVRYFAKSRTFIAVQTVTDAQKLEKQLNERMPGSAVAIFSRYHEKATDEMIATADKVIKSEQFPEDIKFLIVNSAYIEGIEIQTECETAIVKQPSVDGIVQAVGRLRQGVDKVIVVLSQSRFFAQTKDLYVEFNNFLTEYRKADELTKREMLLGMYSMQKEEFGHELVTIHGRKGYIPNYQINMALYHSLEIQLNDAQRLYCEDGEISPEQFEKLENTFRPYFPDTKFIRMTEEGFVSKEEQFNEKLREFLNDIVGNTVYVEENQNGISVAKLCRKVMQLREQFNLNYEKPVKDLKSLNYVIKPYGFKLGNRTSIRDKNNDVPVKVYKLIHVPVTK